MDDNDLTMPELLLTLYLIEYHRHSFSVRSQGIISSGTFDPPEVRELVNLIAWRGGGMKGIKLVQQMDGLHGMIKNNADKLKTFMSRVRDGNMSTHLLEEINQLNREIVAADALMGYIADDR